MLIFFIYFARFLYILLVVFIINIWSCYIKFNSITIIITSWYTQNILCWPKSKGSCLCLCFCPCFGALSTNDSHCTLFRCIQWTYKTATFFWDKYNCLFARMVSIQSPQNRSRGMLNNIYTHTQRIVCHYFASHSKLYTKHTIF